MSEPLSREEFEVLIKRGLTPEQIASFEAGNVPPRSPDWRDRMLAALPAAGAVTGGTLGGVAGAAAGGIGAVPGAAVGGGLGAASGRILENYGRRLMGMPPVPSMLEGLGVDLPGPLSEAAGIGEQAAFGAVPEAIGTKLFGLPGLAPGALATGARGVATRVRDKAATQAVEKVRALRKAGDITPDIQKAETGARASRRAAGRTLGKALDQPGEITIKNIVDDIRAEQAAKFDGQATPEAELVPMVRNRLMKVLPEHTTGAVKGSNLVYTRKQGHRAQRAFDELTRGQFAKAQRGVTEEQGLDEMIANSFRKRIAEGAPGVAPAKGRAAAAIKEHQDVLKELRRARGQSVQNLRGLRQERVAAAAARMPGEGPRIGWGVTGPQIHSPKLADAADFLAGLLQQPGVAVPGRFTPDMINALIQSFNAPVLPDETLR